MKSSKDLLDDLKRYCIKTFDFLTLYTIISNYQLKARLNHIIERLQIHRSFIWRVFILIHCIKMLEFLIYNIIVKHARRVYKQTRMNCVPLLVDLFLYLHETGFIADFLK